MTVFGLPLHSLIVHATVVLVPAAAMAVLLAALWPRFRRWASWGPPAAAVLAVVLVPITTSSGESLESALPHSDLIERHSELADGLLPWVIVLLVGAAALFYAHLASTRAALWTPPRWLVVLVTVVAVVAAVGTLVEVVRIGPSGATAAWSDVSSAGTPSWEGGRDDPGAAGGASAAARRGRSRAGRPAGGDPRHRRVHRRPGG